MQKGTKYIVLSHLRATFSDLKQIVVVLYLQKREQFMRLAERVKINDFNTTLRDGTTGNHFCVLYLLTLQTEMHIEKEILAKFKFSTLGYLFIMAFRKL